MNLLKTYILVFNLSTNFLKSYPAEIAFLLFPILFIFILLTRFFFFFFFFHFLPAILKNLGIAFSRGVKRPTNIFPAIPLFRGTLLPSRLLVLWLSYGNQTVFKIRLLVLPRCFAGGWGAGFLFRPYFLSVLFS